TRAGRGCLPAPIVELRPKPIMNATIRRPSGIGSDRPSRESRSFGMEGARAEQRQKGRFFHAHPTCGISKRKSNRKALRNVSILVAVPKLFINKTKPITYRHMKKLIAVALM